MTNQEELLNAYFNNDWTSAFIFQPAGYKVGPPTPRCVMLFFHYTTFFLLLPLFSDATEHHNYDADVKNLTSELTGEELTGVYSAYTLDNGLDVVIHSHNEKGIKKIRASLTVGVGTSGVSQKEPILEQAIPGLAHLVEHSIFYGSNKFSRPFEIIDYLNSHDGLLDASTETNHTFYEFEIYVPNIINESLERFADLFTSPIFTAESVSTESAIINNEWLEKVHKFSSVAARYPQLLMTEGQPSELFDCGNLETLKDITSEQVELFWKTHYTPDNMKLAISVHQDFKDTVHKAVLDYFSLIPRSSKSKKQIKMPPPAPFWSEKHENQYMKVHSPDFRRNELHLYWHFHCDNEAVCHDSLQMTVNTIWRALYDKIDERQLGVSCIRYSYDDYILQVTVRVRDKELSSMALLKNQIIDEMKENIPNNKKIDKYSMNFNSSPMNLPKRLSKAMMFGPLTEAPLRAHVDFVYSKNAEKLMKEQLNVLLEESPRVIVSYKGTFYKNAMQRNLLLDPYYFIYYEFVNDLGNEELPQVRSSEPLDSSIGVMITHSKLSFPYKFLRGMLIEMILIKLKKEKLHSKLDLDDSSVFLKVFLEKPEFGEDTMKILIEAFTSLSDPSQELFEKSKNRWLLEYQNITTEMSSGDIAAEYAKLLTSPNLLGETSVFISDPYPENITLEEVKKAGGALPRIGVSAACPFFPEDSVENEENLEETINSMWSSVSAQKSDHVSSFAQPASGETLIYCPSPIPTVNSEATILFSLGESFEKYSMLLKNILSPFIYNRLRTEMKLTYTPHIGILSEKYIYIMVSSLRTPQDIQEVIYKVIAEVPEYIRQFEQKKWRNLVVDSLAHLKHHSLPLLRLLITDAGIESVIDKVRLYFIGNESGRLIIHFWGRDQGPAREEYLDKMRLAPLSIQLIETISEFPRLVVDQSEDDFDFDDDYLNSLMELIQTK